MPSLIETFGIDRLTPEDKFQLVMELLDSLDSRPEPSLTEAQRRELDRRLAALDAGTTSLRPWEEVEARVLGRLRG
jgi:putative addiction module component (TIGR02574 family)